MHCKLETIPGLEFLRCPSDTDTKSDCQGDGCETVESALYKVPDNQNVTPVPVFETVMLSSLLERASDRLEAYEEQTHQDRRLAEEIREAAGDLVNRLNREGSPA